MNTTIKKNNIMSLFRIVAVFMMAALVLVTYIYLNSKLDSHYASSYRNIQSLLVNKTLFSDVLLISTLIFILRIPFCIILDYIDISFIFAPLGILLMGISILMINFNTNYYHILASVSYALFMSTYYYKAARFDKRNALTFAKNAFMVLLGLFVGCLISEIVLGDINTVISKNEVSVYNNFNYVKKITYVFLIAFFILFVLMIIASLKYLKLDINIQSQRKKELKINDKEKKIDTKRYYMVIFIILSIVVIISYAFFFFDMFIVFNSAWFLIVPATIISFVLGAIYVDKKGDFLGYLISGIVMIIAYIIGFCGFFDINRLNGFESLNLVINYISKIVLFCIMGFSIPSLMTKVFTVYRSRGRGLRAGVFSFILFVCFICALNFHKVVKNVDEWNGFIIVLILAILPPIALYLYIKHSELSSEEK